MTQKKLDLHFFASFLFIGGHYAEALCRVKGSYQRSPYPWLSLNSLEVNYLLRCTIYLLSNEPSEPGRINIKGTKRTRMDIIKGTKRTRTDHIIKGTKRTRTDIIKGTKRTLIFLSKKPCETNEP